MDYTKRYNKNRRTYRQVNIKNWAFKIIGRLILYYEGIIRNVTEIKRASDIQKVLLKISQNGYKNQDLKDYNKFIIIHLNNIIYLSYNIKIYLIIFRLFKNLLRII